MYHSYHNIVFENQNISKADVLLFSCDPLPWLKVFLTESLH